jgi:cation diffusion facilitator CzcD-associated flavoprotein CzcO
MAIATAESPSTKTQDEVETTDVVVIGAGFSGVYALHQLRKRGYDFIAFEAGDGVGGTWYWNRYPGARVDIESMEYSYSFDEDLQQEWQWPEFFSPQADLEAYANHVTDRFGLRELIRFSSRVDRMRWDDDTKRWHVHTSNGHNVIAKWVIAATGSLDATNIPDWPGVDSFQGQWHHTSTWPKEGVDFTDKKVGLIGTGSTGIQVTPIVAAEAGHLTVFQRTPNYSMPSNNRPLDPEYEREWKQEYAERRVAMRTGAQLNRLAPPEKSIFEVTEEERNRILEEAWNARSGFGLLRRFKDTSVNIEANNLLAEFVRGKIRQIVKDPVTAELLCPKDYPIGAKRICMDTGYYDAFNRDNVSLVDVKTNPIVEVTPTGLKTTAAEYDLDIIIFATGFDAMTGSMTRMNITGVGGAKLEDHWADGPRNFLGIFVSGFPNLFMIHGPGSPSVLAQMITGGEMQVDWVLDFIDKIEEDKVETVDVTYEAEAGWLKEMEVHADKTLYPRASSWYLGANIPGKPRVFSIFIGGFDTYMRRCNEQVEKGYEGFVLGR